MYTSSKSALLNRLEHLQDEVRTLERRNEIDCSCRPTCWCHDKPYSVSGISVLKTRIEEIRNELTNVWEIKTV